MTLHKWTSNRRLAQWLICLQWRIYIVKLGRVPPFSVRCFHFQAVFEKIWRNNRLAFPIWGWYPLWEILDLTLAWFVIHRPWFEAPLLYIILNCSIRRLKFMKYPNVQLNRIGFLKVYYNLPQLDSSLKSPQSSRRSHVCCMDMHLPFPHVNSTPSRHSTCEYIQKICLNKCLLGLSKKKVRL